MTVLARCKPAGPCTLDSNLIALLLLLYTQNFVQLEAAGSMSITCLQPLHYDRETRTSALFARGRSEYIFGYGIACSKRRRDEYYLDDLWVGFTGHPTLVQQLYGTQCVQL
jgi:hypothetical protein